MQVVIFQCKECRNIVADTCLGASLDGENGVILDKLAHADLGDIRKSKDGDPVQLVACAQCNAHIAIFNLQGRLQHKYKLFLDRVLSYKLDIPVEADPSVQSRLKDLERVVEHIYGRIENGGG